MNQATIDDKQDILCLTPDTVAGPTVLPDPWPIASTNPNIMIPAVGQDGSLYQVEKIEAHVKGLQHLALSIFVFSGDELLIQRRARNKYHCGGQWANTCCTHPHFGEDLNTAATRRLREELGFHASLEHRLIVDYCADVGGDLWENERVHMFRAEVMKKDIIPHPNPAEVSEVRWISRSDLRDQIENNPENFTPWLRIYVGQYPELNF